MFRQRSPIQEESPRAGPAPAPSSPIPAPSSEPAAAPSSEPAAAPCPPEMQQIDGFCIDRYEDHLEWSSETGEQKTHPHYERPVRGVAWTAVSAPGVFPQAYIHRGEAEEACGRATKRLCTLSEWYRACRGPKGFIYPYGNREIPGKCNTGRPHLLSRMFGTNPSAWKYEEHFNSPLLDQEPEFLAKTGAFAECVSGYGVNDMAGNLHEWVSDMVDETLPKKIPLQEDILKKVGPRTGNSIFMGGFFSTTNEHGHGCRFVTIGHGSTYHDYSTGFRCCKDAQPNRQRQQAP